MSMNRDSLAITIKAHEDQLKWLRSINTGCAGCDHFADDLQSFCSHWMDNVPADHQKAGCDAWTFDEVPF